MPLAPLPSTDTRPFFRPVTTALSDLLRTLPADDWLKPAVGTWQVRDVAAHLIDVTLRRLALHRDGHTPDPPPFAIEHSGDFTRFINDLNAEWTRAARRLSMRLLAEMYESAAAQLSAWFEALPMDAPALFGVSWAGETASAGWFDVGRDFTEQWHHQAQIREAVGAPPLAEPAWLHAVLLIALRGLPHAYRDHVAADGAVMGIHVTGDAGGHWALERSAGSWRLLAGEAPSPTASVVLTDDAAWRLLFNALPASKAREAVRVSGDLGLAAPFFRARSVIV